MPIMVFLWLVLTIDEFLQDFFQLILEQVYNLFEFHEYPLVIIQLIELALNPVEHTLLIHLLLELFYHAKNKEI